MEQIRKAVELARSSEPAESASAPQAGRGYRPPGRLAQGHGDGTRFQHVALNPAHLEAQRIIAHDISDHRGKAYDMLRTQVLRTMDLQSWQVLAVTSPTAGCGKTTTAINLALSIARQPERSVLLVDMDLQKPQVAHCLGIKCEIGLLSVVEGHAALEDALLSARVGARHLTVLPIEMPTANSSEFVASRAMGTLLKDLRREFHSHTIIFDMPPMLVSDEVITILPQLDCVLLVAAVGTTTPAEISECNRHLQSAEIVRLVVNKVPDSGSKYYY